jgi:uncharacterized coiled-coil protein SlyX
MRRGYRMIIRLGFAAVLLGLLAGCQTTQPLWFIATPGYVEAQLAMREEALRQDYEGRIEELEKEVAEQRAVADELAGLAEVIREVEASNQELQTLATAVEAEIEDMPEETIRIIVEVLSRHLEAQ